MKQRDELQALTKAALVEQAKAAGHSFDQARASKDALVAMLLGAKVIPARFPSKCNFCGGGIGKGEFIVHDAEQHKAAHPACWLNPENAGQQQQQQQQQQQASSESAGDLFDRQEQNSMTTQQQQQQQAGIPTEAGNAIAMAVASAIGAALAGFKPGIDAAEVKSIVQQCLNDIPPRVIEIKQAGELMAKLEGIHHPALPDLIRALSIPGMHVWMAGPAGSGKTTLAKQAAKALGRRFYMNGALLAKHEVSGFVDAGGRIISTPFREAWTNGGVYLHDEADGSAPAAFLAQNAALAGDVAEFPGVPEPVPMHPEFVCIVAANTWGAGANADYVGRNKLDAATLDRFVFLPIDYDERFERAIAGNDEWVSYVQRVRKVARERGKRVIISPRASIKGAQLLSAGFTLEQAKQLALFARMSSDDRRELEAA